MNIGFAVKELRTYARMSQKELAKKSGLTQGYISNVEHGRQHPTTKVLTRICKALDVPQSVLSMMALDILDVKPKYRVLFVSMKAAIDDMLQDILKQIYGRPK